MKRVLLSLLMFCGFFTVIMSLYYGFIGQVILAFLLFCLGGFLSALTVGGMAIEWEEL